jgi:hypothetical protein
MAERIRIEIGFDGGQGLGALITIDEADKLEDALAKGGDGVFKIEAEDGHYAVALRKVVFVKRYAREQRVGFGAAA